MSRMVDVVLVFGSKESSNSNRLREVAERHGARAYLVENIHHVDPAWLAGVRAVGITAGASTPEEIVQEAVTKLLHLGGGELVELHGEVEDIEFRLPAPLLKAAREAGL